MDAIAIAPSGKEIATGCRDTFVHFWNPQTGAPMRHDIRHGDPVLALSYHPEGKTIATGCGDHTARIWSLDSGEQQGAPFYLNGRAAAVRFTPNGNAILVGGIEDTEVNFYDSRTHNSLYLPLPHPTCVSYIT